MERYAVFMLHLEYSLKYKISLQGGNHVLLYLIESHLNFDKTLRY